ncbi:hypothetical protein MY11210_008267 [Beauveria gryllotalpidicola]
MGSVCRSVPLLKTVEQAEILFMEANIQRVQQDIPRNVLSKTYQDTVTTVRAMGIPYIRIVSLRCFPYPPIYRKLPASTFRAAAMFPEHRALNTRARVTHEPLVYQVQTAEDEAERRYGGPVGLEQQHDSWCLVVRKMANGFIFINPVTLPVSRSRSFRPNIIHRLRHPRVLLLPKTGLVAILSMTSPINLPTSFFLAGPVALPASSTVAVGFLSFFFQPGDARRVKV